MIRMGNKIVVTHTKLTKIFANFICGGPLTNSAHKDLLGLVGLAFAFGGGVFGVDLFAV